MYIIESPVLANQRQISYKLHDDTEHIKDNHPITNRSVITGKSICFTNIFHVDLKLKYNKNNNENNIHIELNFSIY